MFGYLLRHDLGQGFPLLTTKRVHLKSIIHELLWFLAGDTNVAYLQSNGVTIDDATNGNNNGIINKNECVNLNVAVKNNGCANETAISATLT